jgi:D-aminopeptidase
MKRTISWIGMLFLIAFLFEARLDAQASHGVRIRDLGLDVGIFKPGKNNAITDVKGVKVGHTTLIEGNDVRTGVTAILPHAGNIFKEKLPAAIYVANGFGKLIGSTQVEELGQIETPIILTNTLSVWVASETLVKYMLELPGNESVQSVNPIVAETNDGYLNDIRGMHVKPVHVLNALNAATGGRVDEGCVGAGTGTTCFGWKGGIGTASRVLPPALGGYTLGVLVQTNYGGILSIDGVPVGKELGQYYFKDDVKYPEAGNGYDAQRDGSCVVVLATDAPLSAIHLKRLAKRSELGIGRTGSFVSNGSGDYVITFSTSTDVRINADSIGLRSHRILSEDMLSPLFQAAVEATEEAIYNSLLKATSMTGTRDHKIEALPLDKLTQVLRKYGKMK